MNTVVADVRGVRISTTHGSLLSAEEREWSVAFQKKGGPNLATALQIAGDTLPTDLSTNGLCSAWFRGAWVRRRRERGRPG
jgi:hypothetical protein